MSIIDSSFRIIAYGLLRLFRISCSFSPGATFWGSWMISKSVIDCIFSLLHLSQLLTKLGIWVHRSDIDALLLQCTTIFTWILSGLLGNFDMEVRVYILPCHILPSSDGTQDMIGSPGFGAGPFVEAWVRCKWRLHRCLRDSHYWETRAADELRRQKMRESTFWGTLNGIARYHAKVPWSRITEKLITQAELTTSHRGMSDETKWLAPINRPMRHHYRAN